MLHLPQDVIAIVLGHLDRRDLLSLSSVNQQLRRVVGPHVFTAASFRLNKIDALLKTPSSLAQFNDYLVISLLQQVDTRSGFNTYVLELEVDDQLLPYIKYFPNIKSLKLLLYEIETPIDTSLRHLSTNIINISKFKSLETIRRLDLLVMFGETPPETFQYLENLGQLQHLNLFISDISGINYKPLVDFLSRVSKSVCKLSIRQVRKLSFHTKFLYDLDYSILSILSQFENLTNFSIDLSIFNRIKHSELPKKRKLLELSLIEPSLVVPSLPESHKWNILAFITSMNVSHINLVYGDPMLQSDLSALALMKDLLATVNIPFSLHQAWSTVNESLLREYVDDLIEQSKLLTLRTIESGLRTSANTPNFRVRYTHADSTVYVQEDPHFWDTEALLLDLEQYAVPPKRGRWW